MSGIGIGIKAAKVAGVPAKRRRLRKIERIGKQKRSLEHKNRVLLEALKSAFRKHCLDDSSIGWNELSDWMSSALAEVMGDRDFQEWAEGFE